MVDFKTLQQLVLSLPETTEQPHFEKTSFRVAKKIFATYDARNKNASIKLNAIDQNVFCAFNKAIIYPVPNKWGQQGWTIIELNLIEQEMLQDALTCAYCEVAPKKLAEKMKW